MKKEFNIGEVVYLITDNDQLERIVTGVLYEPNQIQYRLVNGTSTSWNFGIEIQKNRNYLKI